MPNIEFKDLSGSIGTELFADTESFLEDLGDDAANIIGGSSNKQFQQTAMTTTVYIPSEHEFPHGVRSTIFLHKPHPIRFPRPHHPVRYPRPIHPVFSGHDA